MRVLALSPPRVGLLHGVIVCPICALSTRNRCSRSFPPSSPVGKPAKLNPSHASAERNNLRSTAATLPKLKGMGLHRNRQSVVACNRRPRVKTAAALTTIVLAPRVFRTRGPCPPKGTNVSPEHWGSQVISADDRLGSVGMRGLTLRRKDAPCADDSLPLVRGSRVV